MAEKKSKKGSKQPEKQTCFYEVLGVGRRADDAEIRKAYLKLALVWHPDKNVDKDPELAAEKFKELQRAYAVLSDADQRAWYDGHRDAILRGEAAGPDESGEKEFDEGINLWPYFSASCFEGFGDNEGGFYQVYRDIFEQIDALEREDEDSEDEDEEEEEDDDCCCSMDLDDDGDLPAEFDHEAFKKKQEAAKASSPAPGQTAGKKGKKGGANKKQAAVAPEFGSSGTPFSGAEGVRNFYSYWKDFATQRSFSGADPYNLYEAPDRRIKRAMERENKKARDKAKKEYNDKVRHLAETVYSTDPRVRKHKLEAARKEREKEEERKREKIEAEARAKEDRKRLQAEYDAMMQEELRQRAEQRKEEPDDGTFDPLVELMEEMKLSHWASDESEEEEELEIFECIACGKTYKSLQQFQSHEKTKKHIAQVKLLRAEVSILPEDKKTETPQPEEEEEAAEAAIQEEAEEEEEEEKPDKKNKKKKGKKGSKAPSPAFPKAAEEEDEPEDDYERVVSKQQPQNAKKKKNARTPKGQREAEEVEKPVPTPPPSKSPSGSSKKKPASSVSPAVGGSSSKKVPVATPPPVPAMESSSDEEEGGKRMSKKDKRREKERKKKEEAAAAAAPPPAAAKKPKSEFACNTCGEDFTTRNSLFKHIKETGHALRL